MSLSDIERAERASRGRAGIMALLAAVVALVSTFGLESPVNDAGWRGATWLLIGGLGLAILATDGGLMLSRRLRAIMYDERTRQHRAHAFAAGFFAAMLSAATLYALSLGTPIEPRAALRLTTGLGLAAALGLYAWLEWR